MSLSEKEKPPAAAKLREATTASGLNIADLAGSANSRAAHLTFRHRFSRSVNCEINITDTPPPADRMFVLPCQWTGRPRPKHPTAYRQWILFVNQTLADRWGQRILYALGTASDETELWTFEPGRPPKLAQKLPIRIP